MTIFAYACLVVAVVAIGFIVTLAFLVLTSSQQSP